MRLAWVRVRLQKRREEKRREETGRGGKGRGRQRGREGRAIYKLTEQGGFRITSKALRTLPCLG